MKIKIFQVGSSGSEKMACSHTLVASLFENKYWANEVKRVPFSPYWEASERLLVDENILILLQSPPQPRYYRTEPMYFKGKSYRLICLIDPDESYLGVVNCYRRKKK